MNNRLYVVKVSYCHIKACLLFNTVIDSEDSCRSAECAQVLSHEVGRYSLPLDFSCHRQGGGDGRVDVAAADAGADVDAHHDCHGKSPVDREVISVASSTQHGLSCAAISKCLQNMQRARL